MAGYLLHENASVLCQHSGQAQPMMTNSRVNVSGNKIVTQLSPYSISGCTLPSNSGGPCATATWMSAATRVKAGGTPVLFQDSQATCAPTGTGLNIVSLQRRVKVT
jgi:hypothetical protein